MSTSPTPIIETLVFECDCGAVHRVTVAHYQVAKMRCGKYLWALQPKRGGPLGLFPWPGMNLTRQEMAEKQLREQKDALEHLTGGMVA